MLSLCHTAFVNRPYLPAEIRRAEAVATVIDLAASHDPAMLTTGQIATAMGVSQGALFRHFPDKMAIWTAVLEATRAELNHRFDMLAAGPPLARLEAMLNAHVDFIMARPGVPRILFGELQRPGVTPGKAIVCKLMAEYRARVASELAQAAESGEIGPGSDVEAATIMFLSLVQGMVMQGLAADDLTTLPAQARRLFGLFRQSLGGPQ